MPGPRKPASPFRYFNSSPEVIRLLVMMDVRFPLSPRRLAAAARSRVQALIPRASENISPSNRKGGDPVLISRYIMSGSTG